ncbi:MAG: GFA family protein [Pseudorhodobacter sp.]
MTMAQISGGCHCGTVRFVADLDLTAQSYRCNCSICTKSRSWLMFTSWEGFSLTSGETALSRYRFGKQAIAHCFCSICGVKTHGEAPSGIAVLVSALDLAPEGFAALGVGYLDGANDALGSEPAVTSYL